MSLPSISAKEMSAYVHKRFVEECSQKLYSSQAKNYNNLNVYQMKNEFKKATDMYNKIDEFQNNCI